MDNNVKYYLEGEWVWVLAPMFICLALGMFLATRTNAIRKEEGRMPVFHLLLDIVLFAASIACFVFCLNCQNIRDNLLETNKTFKEKVTLERKLCALGVSEELSGSGKFTLGSGSFVIDTTTNYHYYYYVDENTVKRAKLSADNNITFKFITDDSEEPRLVRYKKTPVVTKSYDGKVIEEEIKTEKAETYYIFYVPQGSIVGLFDLN